jgi:integrase
MEECFRIFSFVENPKHKLLLLIGYGAGLRRSEIVTLIVSPLDNLMQSNLPPKKIEKR